MDEDAVAEVAEAVAGAEEEGEVEDSTSTSNQHYVMNEINNLSATLSSAQPTMLFLRPRILTSCSLLSTFDHSALPTACA